MTCGRRSEDSGRRRATNDCHIALHNASVLQCRGIDRSRAIGASVSGDKRNRLCPTRLRHSGPKRGDRDESKSQVDRRRQLRRRDRQRTRGRRRRRARLRRAQSRAAADGARARRHGRLHGVRRRADPEEGAPADRRLRRRGRGRARARGAQGVHPHPSSSTGCAARASIRAQVERAVKLSKEKYCSATLMLAKTAEISYEIESIDGDAVSEAAR